MKNKISTIIKASRIQYRNYSSVNKLSGKTAIVTGGSRGIGKEIVQKLAESGVSVSVLARNQETIDNFLPTLPVSSTQKHFGFTCDVGNSSQLTETFKKVEEAMQGRPLDILVNSAGINVDGLLLRMNEKDMEKILDTNLLGSIIACKLALRFMMKNKSLSNINTASIVNIGSIVGSMGNVGQCVYSASKAGLIGFTKSLALEYGQKGVRANVIEPGFIETDMTSDLLKDSKQLEEKLKRIPLRRIGKADAVADMVLAVIQNDYVTGEVIKVTGGLQ